MKCFCDFFWNFKVIGVDDHTFSFDNIIDDAKQSEIYDILAKPMIAKAIEGFSSILFAYGQTGTGKTHTLGFDTTVSNDIKNNNDRHVYCGFSTNRKNLKILELLYEFSMIFSRVRTLQKWQFTFRSSRYITTKFAIY